MVPPLTLTIPISTVAVRQAGPDMPLQRVLFQSPLVQMVGVQSAFHRHIVGYGA